VDLRSEAPALGPHLPERLEVVLNRSLGEAPTPLGQAPELLEGQAPELLEGQVQALVAEAEAPLVVPPAEERLLQGQQSP